MSYKISKNFRFWLIGTLINLILGSLVIWYIVKPEYRGNPVQLMLLWFGLIWVPIFTFIII